MRMLDIVGVQGTRKGNRLHNGIVGFSQMPQDKIGLGDNACPCRHINHMGNLLFRDVLPHGIQNALTARFNAEFNRMAASFLHHLQDIQIRDEVHSTATRPRERLSCVNHGLAKGFQALAVSCKHIIIE